MRLEKQNIPSSSRTKVNQRLRNYDTDVDGYKRKLRSLADDRAALFGGRYSDNPGAGGSDVQLEQRQQLLAGTDRLDRSTQRLKASQALANETEAIGAGTLADLVMPSPSESKPSMFVPHGPFAYHSRSQHRQRETIQHTSDILLESEGYVDRSVKTLRGMARR